VTLRRALIAYLLGIHLFFATVVVLLLWDQRIWFVAVEAFLLVSSLAAIALFRGLFRPLELIASGVEFLRERDFSTRLRETGPPEMNRLIGVFNQMVDSLRTERLTIQEQHYFLDKILQVSPSAIIILDHEGTVSYANPSAHSLLRFPEGGIRGKKVAELGTSFASQMERLEPGAAAIIPLLGMRKVLLRKSTFLDRGHPRTFYLFEELTEELRKSERAAYEKVIRMLSHEVNNSLGAANSLLHSCLHYAGQLREEDRGDFETALTVAIARTDHLNAFMKGFADILRLPAPRRVFADVRVPLENIARLLHAELARRRISIVWDDQGTRDPVLMDAQQMEQVFLNVLKNAMEAIGADGTITIRLGRVNGRETITIEDTGPGIAEEVRVQLFTPFFSTKENGQGIGLTLVQEILRQHQFEFTLESAPGEPTRFVIYLENGGR
jgi:nitrogen fixation/metabolism regulation signal transduction histidine kinase